MIQARQKRWYSRFEFELLGADSEVLGSITWPDMAVARNGRLRGVVPASWEKNVRIRLKDKTYTVEYEHLRRGWVNDVRFWLSDGAVTLSSVDILQRRWARPEIRITQPLQATLVRRRSWVSLLAPRYDVIAGTERIGSIGEAGGLSLRRRIQADLPDTLEVPVQAFLTFNMIHCGYR